MEKELTELIHGCKNGSLGSFEILVGQFRSRVSGIIYKIVGASSDVDDIAQEVFLKIYKNIGGFREESKFSTWVYRITVNTVWDFLRRAKTKKTIPLENADPVFVRDRHDKQELFDLLNKNIQELPVNYRTIIVLKDIEDLSYAEIAEVLKCRIGTVESRLFRARQCLREKLKESSLWGDLYEL